MTDDIPDLTDADFASAIPARVRHRLMRGQLLRIAARHPRILRENLESAA